MPACGHVSAAKCACENTVKCVSKLKLLVCIAGSMTLLLYLNLFLLSGVCLSEAAYASCA